MRAPIDKTVTVDFETAVGKGYSLEKMGARDYVRDPRFEILTVSVAVGGEAIRFFHAAAASPEQSLEAGRTLLARAATNGHVLVAHNVGFDGLVAKLAWDLSFSQYFDTTGYARYLGVGASLGNVAALFGYRKLEAPPFTMDTLRDPHARSRLARYNAADVAIARLVYRAALDDHGYPDAEFSINDLTSRMNLDGLMIDTARAAELAAQAATLQASAMSELASSYAVDTTALRRPAAIRAFAERTWGLSLGSLDKRDADMRSAIRAVQEADRFFRLRDRIHTLSRAVQKLRSYASVEGGRVYGFLRYYGAHTGRFAAGGRDANKVNVHQLFKVKNRARIPELGAERGVVVAPAGRNFVAADLATVEARVVAWVADEASLLEQFRLPDTDVYVWFVQQIFVGVRIVKDGENDHLRQLGKETILGLGFGMGYNTFLKKVREAMPEVDADIVRTLFDAYQASFPRVRALRYALMSAFSRAVTERASSVVGRCAIEPCSDPLSLSPSVIVRLPSGRALYYRSVVVESEPTPWGSKPVFWYAPHANLTDAPARARGKGELLFADGQRRVRLTPQVLVENIVQAIARDVMVHQVLEIARLGLRPAFHAHDEEVFECDACSCPDGQVHEDECMWVAARSLVERVMSSVPSTLLPGLDGLPLKAEAKHGVKERYA